MYREKYNVQTFIQHKYIYSIYTGSKTEENHFRLDFHNNIITCTFIYLIN